MKKLLGLLLAVTLLISITTPYTAYAKKSDKPIKQLTIDYTSNIGTEYFVDPIHNNIVPWVKNNSLYDFAEVKISVVFYLNGKVVDSVDKVEKDFKSYYSVLYTVPIETSYDSIKIIVTEVVR